MWRAETKADRERAKAAQLKKWAKENTFNKPTTVFKLTKAPSTEEKEIDEAYMRALEESNERYREELRKRQQEWDTQVANLPTCDDAVPIRDIYRKGLRLRRKGVGLKAAQTLWMSVVVGVRSAAIDLYEMLLDGESGVARHTFLAAVMFGLGVALSDLRERSVKEGIPRHVLDTRLAHASDNLDERKRLFAQAREMASSYTAPLYPFVQAIESVVLESERLFVSHGCTLYLVQRQLEKVDQAVSDAVRSEGGYEFPLRGLGGHHNNEWSILDFLEIPEQLPEWEMADKCRICDIKFTFFKRRHHCRNCGASCCNDHSDSYFDYMLGRREVPKDQQNRDEQGRVCDVCHDLILNFDDEGVKRPKERPPVPDIGPFPVEGESDDEYGDDDDSDGDGHGGSVWSEEALSSLPVKRLREILQQMSVPSQHCLEKFELVQLVLQSQ